MARTLLAVPLCLGGLGQALAEGYTPPAPLSSVGSLMSPPQDNGYGLGALIESQQQAGRGTHEGKGPGGGTGDDSRRSVPASVSAATAAVRQAQAARRQAGVLQAEVDRLRAQLATRQSQQGAARGEVAALQARVQTLTAQLATGSQREKQLVDSEQARAVLVAEKAALQRQLDTQQGTDRSAAQKLVAATAALTARETQLRVQGKQLDALQSQLSLSGAAQKQLATRTAELTTLRQQMTVTRQLLDDNRARLTEAQAALAKTRAEPAGPVADLTTAAGRQDYVVGQTIAAGLRDRLQSYAAAGLTLTRGGVLAGISDGLDGAMKMNKADMDTTYRAFARTLQQEVDRQVREGEAQMAAATKGKTLAKDVNGMRYVVLRKGASVTDPDAPVSLALTESVLQGGRVLSKIPQLTLSPEDDMPAVVREALPLLGKGAEVKAWALARAVYGTLPLPRGIEPYTVLTYDMKGLAVGTSPARPAPAGKKQPPNKTR
jgi:hypothetical protein